jgi:hypothetical protein
MQQKSSTSNGPVVVDRWILIRDVAAFQAKLIVDGLRDLVLVPASLVAGVISLLKGGTEPGSEFYDLLRVGRRSEHWINLFGAAERLHGPATLDDHFPADDIDEIMSRVESFVVDEYNKGGVTAQAKKRFDQALDKLSDVANRKRRQGPE